MFSCRKVLGYMVKTNFASRCVTSARHVSTVCSDASFETKPYKLHKLTESPSRQVNLTREEGIKLYSDMVTIRVTATAIKQLWDEKLIRGFANLYTGQEAVAVGMEAAINKEDAVIAAYRIHGLTYVRGISLFEIFAELTGGNSGCSRGKGGTIHMFSKNFYGGHGIVGAQVPVGAGIALAMQYQKKDSVCLTLYGDGASNQGQVFEAFNIAKLWNLPCIFLCENNYYGMNMSCSDMCSNTEFYTRGDYIPGIWVDGMDVLAIREVIRFAKTFSQKYGPIVIEASTFRFDGHGVYNTFAKESMMNEAIQMKETQDPLKLFKSRLLSSGLLQDNDVKMIWKAANTQVTDAVRKARADIEPTLDELYRHEYAD